MTAFHTPEDLAQKLHNSPRTIQRWARERRIPYVRIGRNVLFTDDQVQQIIEAYSVEPVTRAPEVDALNPAFNPRGPVVVPMRKPA